MRAGRALERGIHLQLEAVDVAGSLNAANLVVVSIGSHRITGSHLVAPHVAVDVVVGAEIRVHQALVGQLAHVLQVIAGLIADGAREILALVVVVAQNKGAAGRALAEADAPAGHGHTVGNIQGNQVGERIGIGIIFFVGLQDLVQIVERLGIVEAFLLQVVLTHDEAAVEERGVRQSGHIIQLSVGKTQRVDLVLHAEFLNISVEVRRPIGIIADGHDRAVQRQRGVLACGRLIQDDVRAVFLRVQREGNLCGQVGRGDGLHLKLQAADLGRLLRGEPVVLPRKRGVIGIIHADMDRTRRGRTPPRGIRVGAAVVGRCRCAGRAARAGDQAHEHHQCQRQRQNRFE